MSGVAQEAANPAAEDAIDDESDADFEAGLAGNDEPTATPAASPAPTPAPSPEPTPAPEYVQITKDEHAQLMGTKAQLAELSDKFNQKFTDIYGRTGALKQTLERLTAATPEGETVAIDAADFEELRREMPEMADLTIKGLNKVLGKLKGTKGADPEAVEKMVTDRLNTALSAVREEQINASLEAVFPGWVEEVKTAEYKAWEKSQTPAVQALAESSKLGDAAKLLRLYEKHKTAPAATPAPTPVPAPAVSTRQRQIAAAVAPKGDGGHAPGRTEDDDFEAGLKYRAQSG